MTWTKERIHAVLDASDRAVERAVVALYNRQTADEQASHTTKEHNGVGFGYADADFCSDIAKKVQRGWSLNPRQIAVTRNKVKRYHRQLVEIANDNEARKATLAPTPSIQAAVQPEPQDEEDAEITRAEDSAVIRMAQQFGMEAGTFA